LVPSTLIPHFKEITEFTSKKILRIQFKFNLHLQSYSLQNVTNLSFVRYIAFLTFVALVRLHSYEARLLPFVISVRLDGPGIESRWGARFSPPVQTDPGAHPASYAIGTGSLPGVKRPGRGVDHPFPASAKVKERVELYLYTTSGLSWLVIG
jgi:hypothetical protein